MKSHTPLVHSVWNTKPLCLQYPCCIPYTLLSLANWAILVMESTAVMLQHDFKSSLMANCKTSDAGSSDMSNGSYKCLFSCEKAQVLNLMREKNYKLKLLRSMVRMTLLCLKSRRKEDSRCLHCHPLNSKSHSHSEHAPGLRHPLGLGAVRRRTPCKTRCGVPCSSKALGRIETHEVQPGER